MSRRTALIIGAGPAGLTAAYELLDRTDVRPIVFEASGSIGGISRTIEYKGNRMDIGGHRFFSKSDRVMNWWLNILPMQGAPAKDDRLLGRHVQLSATARQRRIGSNEAKTIPPPDPEETDEVMLVRDRLSRILFLRKFFDYPISLSPSTIRNLGLGRLARVGASYLKAKCLPLREEKSLEDFFINQFGTELYRTFFRDYTEKVWGVPCKQIPAEWGAQRVKGLSLTKAVLHALRGMAGKRNVKDQKNVETSLIDSFLYPKYGPGQLWETVANQVREHGGEIRKGVRVCGLRTSGFRVTGLEVQDDTDRHSFVSGDYVLSSMPVRELVPLIGDSVPNEVRQIADGLKYRDFLTVGVLTRNLRLANDTNRKTVNNSAPDNWIYVQESDVKVGRLQIFNNWSPYMVADTDTTWMGMEYFCDEGDDLWSKSDQEFSTFAITELEKLGVVDQKDVLDTHVVRVQKAYPAYFGSYSRFKHIKEFLDRFANLFLIGRNGMHRYNNQDHSMLSAMSVVDLILSGSNNKSAVWSVNSEEEYHEAKS